MRYLAMTGLLARPEDDPETESARERIAKKGWAHEILSRQNPEGWWVTGESVYRPKYTSTNWMLLILSDLGLTKANPGIAAGCELWIQRLAKRDGGFGTDGAGAGHLCVTGNAARALVRFGYLEDPRVTRALDWLVKSQDDKGGWSCFGSGRNLDSWEAMSAFAVYPRQLWTRSLKHAVEKGAEFYLERELHIQGAHYEPWYRFHYPIHYYYDLLVGLDFMTALGYGSDRRLGHAVSALKKKMRPDGRWNLDAVHPDLEGGAAGWYAKNPPHPFSLEVVGKPSKMITLTALRVLERLGQSPSNAV
jgi:hypothetical protein